MISKAKAKFIKSLQVKKYRKDEQCFVVEGAKGVAELMRSDFEVMWLAGTESFLRSHHIGNKQGIDVTETTEQALASLGSFTTNNAALAIARMRPNAAPKLNNGFALVLDDIRDPGNLGTIIRTADWYGINKIIASEETADFYNPKVISATMGSFCRVNVYYTELHSYLTSKTDWPLFGATLAGESIYNVNFGQKGFIVVGNESNGISSKVLQLIEKPITIPRIGEAESLNASIATAIVLDNVFRLKK